MTFCASRLESQSTRASRVCRERCRGYKHICSPETIIHARHLRVRLNCVCSRLFARHSFTQHSRYSVCNHTSITIARTSSELRVCCCVWMCGGYRRSRSIACIDDELLKITKPFGVRRHTAKSCVLRLLCEAHAFHLFWRTTANQPRAPETRSRAPRACARAYAERSHRVTSEAVRARRSRDQCCCNLVTMCSIFRARSSIIESDLAWKKSI